MSDATNLAAAPNAAPAAAETVGFGLLEQAIGATKQTERNQAETLIGAFVEEALKGTLSYDKNLSLTITRTIEKIDAEISRQLNAVVHHPRFQKLEGTWRGLN